VSIYLCREICTFEPRRLSLVGSIGYTVRARIQYKIASRPTDIQNINYMPMDPPNYPTYGTSVPTSSLYLRSSNHVYFTSFTNDAGARTVFRLYKKFTLGNDPPKFMRIGL